MASPASLTGIRSLYVCYFSVREPPVQSQVLAYLRELTEAGARVWLLTREDEDLKRRCAAVASREYDLHSIGGTRYRRLDRTLIEPA